MAKVPRGHGPWPPNNDEHAVLAWLIQRLGMLDDREAKSTALWLMDSASSSTRGDRLMNSFKWPESMLDRLALWGDRIQDGEPIQYVLGEAWFDGLKLKVGPGVLIPRPETEELMAAMARVIDQEGSRSPKIVDWCTGSGCMALALKRRIPDSSVLGLDISEEALTYAQENAARLGLDVEWGKQDLLNPEGAPEKPADVVVCNPPYIPNREASDLDDHVVHHEPHLALFVSDEDPLAFHHALVAWAEAGGLAPGGWLGMECHRDGATSLAHWLKALDGWQDVDILRDLQGMTRHVVARRCLT